MQPTQGSPVWGNFRPNRQKPLILLGHFDFSPAKRPLKKNFFSPVFTPAAARRARPHAPPRALPRHFTPFRAASKNGRSRRDFHPSAPPFRLFDHRQQRLGGGGGGGGGCGLLRNFLTKDFGTALRQRQATVLIYLSHPCFQSRDFGRVQFCERETLPTKIFQRCTDEI